MHCRFLKCVPWLGLPVPGGVEGNEDLEKDMFWEEKNEKEVKAGLEDSEEQGKAKEENMEELAAKEDKEKNSNGDKRERKEEEKEKDEKAQEFDDH